MPGIGIVQASKGAVGINTVYAAMGRLCEKNYVAFREVSAVSVRRRYYTVTKDGREAYLQYRAASKALQEKSR